MSDPLETILGPRPLPAVPPGVYSATVAALRRERRWQRVRSAVVLTACAAGVLLALLTLLPRGRGPGGSAGTGSAAKNASPPAPATAAALEWRALEGRGPAAPVYIQAGDRYLDEADPGNAVRCYGNALNEGGKGEGDVAESDSYLLMAIKLARKKERDTCER